jgi:hypothetical protein
VRVLNVDHVVDSHWQISVHGHCFAIQSEGEPLIVGFFATLSFANKHAAPSRSQVVEALQQVVRKHLGNDVFGRRAWAQVEKIVRLSGPIVGANGLTSYPMSWRDRWFEFFHRQWMWNMQPRRVIHFDS